MAKSEKDRLQGEIRKLQGALNEITDKEREAQARPLVGKCFKVKNNYSCPSKASDYWNLYIIVTQMVEGGFLKTFEFQKDKHGRIDFRENDHNYAHTLTGGGYVTITRNEFNRQYDAILKSLARRSF